MTVTVSAANFNRTSDTSIGSGDPMVVVLPSDVPAGGTIILGLLNRTDETATITSVSDPVNGTWTGMLRQGPTDNTSGNARTWLYAFTNSAALTGGANRTLTIMPSSTISAQAVAGWVSSDAGAMTFDANGTVLDTTATNWDSNTVSASGAGVAIGFLGVTSAQASVTVDGAGETHLTTASDAGSFRTNLFSEIVASASTPAFEITLPTSTSGNFHIMSLLEPGGAPAATKRCMMMGIG